MSDSQVITVSKALQEIARALDTSLQALTGERIPFMLVIFPGETTQYVSNIDREVAALGMAELLEKWDKNKEAPDVPAHKVN